MFPW